MVARAELETHDGEVREGGAAGKIDDPFAEPGAVMAGAFSSSALRTQQTGFGHEGPKTEITAIDGSKVDGKAGSQYTANDGVRFAGQWPNVTGKQARVVAGYLMCSGKMHGEETPTFFFQGDCGREGGG